MMVMGKARVALRNPKSLLSGLFFVAVGLFAAIHATDYPVGRVTRMGPGYFPLILGVALVLLGSVNVLRAFAWAPVESIGKLSLKPLLLVPASVVLFAFLLESTGLLVAMAAMVVLASAAERSFRPLEVAGICLVVGILASLLYVFGLGLPPELLLHGRR